MQRESSDGQQLRNFHVSRRREALKKRRCQRYICSDESHAVVANAYSFGLPKPFQVLFESQESPRQIEARPRKSYLHTGKVDLLDAINQHLLATLNRTGDLLDPEEKPLGRFVSNGRGREPGFEIQLHGASVGHVALQQPDPKTQGGLRQFLKKLLPSERDHAEWRLRLAESISFGEERLLLASILAMIELNRNAS